MNFTPSVFAEYSIQELADMIDSFESEATRDEIKSVMSAKQQVRASR